MENVETFIDQLIDEKGLGVEGDVRKQLKLDMMERLLDQIDRASINALPEDKAIELADSWAGGNTPSTKILKSSIYKNL